jgi:hypothetical protein
MGRNADPELAERVQQMRADGIGLLKIGRTRGRPMDHRAGWWTGDVWRAALLLKRRRPDLQITTVDAFPTGLVLITNVDPSSRYLSGTTLLAWRRCTPCLYRT